MSGEHFHVDLTERLGELEEHTSSLERRIQKAEHDYEQLRSRLNRAEVDLYRRAEEYHDHSDYAKTDHTH